MPARTPGEFGRLIDDLRTVEQELTELEQEDERLFEAARYSGADEVISSYQAKKEIEEQRRNSAFEAQTTIPKLDSLIGGFREGNLVVVSAPTKQGKTTLCQTFTTAFEKQNISCLWFSYEVPMAEFLEKFPTLPVFYVPRKLKDNTLEWIEAKIIEGIAKHRTKIVFIDHLHYLISMGFLAKSGNMSLLIGGIMRELKKLAVKYGIVIFVIAHTKKTRNDARLELDDIRDSSFIAQEADIVLMLWRKRKQTEHGEIFIDESVLSVAANRRTGKTGYVPLLYSNNQFAELANDYGEHSNG